MKRSKEVITYSNVIGTKAKEKQNESDVLESKKLLKILEQLNSIQGRPWLIKHLDLSNCDEQTEEFILELNRILKSNKDTIPSSMMEKLSRISFEKEKLCKKTTNLIEFLMLICCTWCLMEY